jgi:molybdopterin-guanine dinucleotide biosynthesis protein
MNVVAVIGAGQNSGKTTAVVALVSEFGLRGLRVGTIKQIHERKF